MTENSQEVKPQDTVAPAVHSGPTGIAGNITSKDLRLPRVALLQSMSPQVQANGDTYKPGMFIDTLTQDIIQTPVSFVPCFIFKNVIKWKPRTEGGGMIYKTVNPTAEQLKDTQFDGAIKPVADLYINAVALVDGFETPLIISFCKTNLKAGQDLATLASLSGCAWKYKYTLESVKTTNTKGTFYVARVKRSILNDDPGRALELYEQVKGMSIETDYEGSTHESTPETDGVPKEF